MDINNNIDLPYNIREAIPSDIPFIYNSWLKSFRFGNLDSRTMRTSVFYENYREVVDNILEQSQVVVACLPDEPSVILGYMVFHKSIIHYMFVKESFRRLGIATTLFKTHVGYGHVTYTHITNEITKHVRSIPHWTYNPFLLYKRG